MTCRNRSSYYAVNPHHRVVHGVPSGDLPHSFTSATRKQVDGAWIEVERHCSWCGKSAT